jgi:hypothetical protein
MKVNWATSPGNAPKQDTSSKFHPNYFFSFLSGEETFSLETVSEMDQ